MRVDKCTLCVLSTQFQLVKGMRFPTPPSVSPIAAEYLKSNSQFWHYLSEDQIWFHRLRVLSHKKATPSYPEILGANCKPRLLHLLLTNWLYKSQIPMTFFLGSITLLEWLTELRETFYFLDQNFYNIGILIRNSQVQKMHKAQRMGKGHGASMPSQGVSLSPNLQASPIQKLSGPILECFHGDSLHRHDWLNHWPLATGSASSLSLLLINQGWDWKF